MKIIGCDFHPSFQQIAMLDTETGELVERRLSHTCGEAKQFYDTPESADESGRWRWAVAKRCAAG